MILVQNRLRPLSGSKLKFSIALFFLVFSFLVSAQEVRIIDGQRYQVHRVEKGHTLFAISKTYSISVDQILESNPNARAGLQVGQEVLIPLGKVDKKAARSNPPEMKGKFLEHTVEKKETLYSISKKYSVEISSIIEHNPEVAAGLQHAQVLKIYVGDVAVASPSIIAPATGDSLIQHLVEPGETLYAISKKYDVSMDSILYLNNGLIDGVKAGTYIRIPRYTAEFRAEKLQNLKGQPSNLLHFASGDAYNIALMLPFSMNIQDSIFRNSDPTKPIQLYTLTDIAVDLYRGVLIAADSLNKLGFSAEIFVYDVSDNLSETRAVLAKPELKNMHLIIGPLHRTSFELVAEFGASKGINVVSPVPNQMLKTSHSTSVTVHPNVDEQMRYLGQYMAKMHFTDKILVVDSKKLKDANYVKTFLDTYNTHYKYGDTLSAFNINKFGLEGLTAKLSSTQKNFIVVPSADVAFVSDFMNRLSNIKSSYNVTVVGMEKWLDYDNIDFNYKERFKLMVPSTAFLDFRKPESVQFIKKYRKEFNTDPGQQGYAFVGYDIALYFMSELHKHGMDYTKHFSSDKYNGLNLSFNFDQQSSGCRNRHIYILQHTNYELKKVN